MYFDPETSGCAFRDCKPPESYEIEDCDFGTGPFPLIGMRKFGSDSSCHEYRSCVKFSEDGPTSDTGFEVNNGNVQVCTFNCDPISEGNPRGVQYLKAYNRQKRECTTPSEDGGCISKSRGPS
jgi:hypothetical protein